MARRTVPAWALQHLKEKLPAHARPLNVVVHRRGVVIANTRAGAAIVTKRPFGKPTLQLVASPRERVRLACPACKEALEFRSIPLPGRVHCGRCGRSIELDARGRAADGSPVQPPAAPPAPLPHASKSPAALAREALAAAEAKAGGGATEAAIRQAVQQQAGDWLGPAVEQERRQLDTMKATFINNAAHELQTPMTPLLLSLENLERGNLPKERSQLAVQQVLRNAKRLEDVITRVVKVAQVQARPLQVQCARVDLGDLLREARDAWQGRADAAGVRLHVVTLRPTSADADRIRLLELLDHLLSNAIRFTPPGGRVTLAVQRTPESAVLSVTDTGCGVPRADAERVFEPFVQLEAARDQTQAGLGLGLFFARAIADAHGGTIRLLPGPRSKGTRVEVTLPRAKRERTPRAILKPSSPPSPEVRP
jgi:signal transduction histidine kinase